MQKVTQKKVRSVEQYLTLLKLGGRSDITIRNYRQILSQYARFLNIPMEDLHNHLDPDNLVRYAASIAHKREAGRKSTLITIHRFMAINGVEFDELERNVVMVKVTEPRDDKPLTPDLLRKMMDQGNPHARALLSFLISTGCRAGETSEILLSDVGRIENGRFIPDINGSVVNIRPEIAKRKKGGFVFLTAEAREYLTVWLKDRDRYICDANARTRQLYKPCPGTSRHDKTMRKGTAPVISRPNDDKRLFACSYTTIDKVFNRMYRRIDGERGVTGNKITAHACRAFFRTHAVKGMSIDLAEGLLRHTGYLNAEYVKMTPEDRQQQFHEGEHALYITRPDHRIQTGELAKIQREKDHLQARLAALERAEQDRAKMLALVGEVPDLDARIADAVKKALNARHGPS